MQGASWPAALAFALTRAAVAGTLLCAQYGKAHSATGMFLWQCAPLDLLGAQPRNHQHLTWESKGQAGEACIHAPTRVTSRCQAAQVREDAQQRGPRLSARGREGRRGADGCLPLLWATVAAEQQGCHQPPACDVGNTSRDADRQGGVGAAAPGGRHAGGGGKPASRCGVVGWVSVERPGGGRPCGAAGRSGGSGAQLGRRRQQRPPSWR